MRDILTRIVRADDGDLYQNRLISLFENGVALHGDFDGRQSAAMIFKSLESETARPEFNMKPWFVNYRSSDNDPMIQKQIMSENNPLRPMHFCKSVEDVHMRFCDTQWVDQTKPVGPLNNGMAKAAMADWHANLDVYVVCHLFIMFIIFIAFVKYYYFYCFFYYFYYLCNYPFVFIAYYLLCLLNIFV